MEHHQKIVEETEIEAVVENETDLEMGREMIMEVKEEEEEEMLMVKGTPEIVTWKEIIMIVKTLEIIPEGNMVRKMDTTENLALHEVAHVVEVVIMTDIESDHEIKIKRKK